MSKQHGKGPIELPFRALFYSGLKLFISATNNGTFSSSDNGILVLSAFSMMEILACLSPFGKSKRHST